MTCIRKFVLSLAIIFLVAPSLALGTDYYIAADGADTNNGTAKETPWARAPGMPNCSNECLTIQTAGPIPDDHFIFKGGDTWHFGNSGASPYTGGTWTWGWLGTSGHPIYIGVDATWYTGGSWSRPILTGDNPTSTSPVASCAYQIGTNNVMVSFLGVSYATFDNFEMTGLCQNDVNPLFAHDVYVLTGSSGNLFERLYIHGWTALAFDCVGTTGHCFNIFVFLGGGTGTQYDQIIVDGSDSNPGSAGVMYGGGYHVSRSVFRYVAQIITTQGYLWHDNLFEHWYQPGDGQAHGNLLEEIWSNAATTHAYYNNVFRHICSDSGSCPDGIVAIWLAPTVGTTAYWFNNLHYDMNTVGNYFNIGQNDADQGTLIIFNNTMEQNLNGFMMGCSAFARPFTVANNHYISDYGSVYTSACDSSKTETTNLLKTHAQATTGGYTAAQTYAYSPAAADKYTVGVGTNKQAYCTALSSAGLTDAATACASDSTYACVYNAANHTVSCPQRTVVARQAVNPWDVGYVDWSGAPDPTPIMGRTPASIAFSNTPLSIASAVATVTVSNTGTATATDVSIAMTGGNTGDFAQTNTCGSMLAVSASCTITVSFTPTALGARSTTLRISSNDPINPTLDVTLTGTGTPMAAPGRSVIVF